MCDPVADGRGTQQGRHANLLAIAASPTQICVRKCLGCSLLRKRCNCPGYPCSLAQIPSRWNAGVNKDYGIRIVRILTASFSHHSRPDCEIEVSAAPHWHQNPCLHPWRVTISSNAWEYRGNLALCSCPLLFERQWKGLLRIQAGKYS